MFLSDKKFGTLDMLHYILEIHKMIILKGSLTFVTSDNYIIKNLKTQ